MIATKLAVFGTLAAALLASSAVSAQVSDDHGQDRRADRHERPGFDADRTGLGHRRADGGRRFRRQGARQADHA